MQTNEKAQSRYFPIDCNVDSCGRIPIANEYSKSC